MIEPFVSETDLTAGLQEIRMSPADGGMLVAIVVRPEKEQRELPESCELTLEAGIPGDRWARYCTDRLPDGQLNPESQLTLMNSRVLALIAGDRRREALAGDNLIVDLDLSHENLPTGQRLKIGGVVIEISAKEHTGCAKFSVRFGVDALNFVNSPEGRRFRLRGALARVIQPGRVSIGERVEKS